MRQSGQRELLNSWTKKDFRVDTFRAGGKGGQHQNKTDSGVRITHLESGLSAESREHRSQRQNKKEALQKLAKLLKQKYCQPRDLEEFRSDVRIRTYHQPRHSVKDHRTGRTYNFEDVVLGNGFGQVVEDNIRLLSHAQTHASADK